MEEIKMEQELKLCEVKKENMHKTMERIQSQANDILILNLQWCDLEDHLKSTEGKVEKMYRQVVSMEAELQDKSFVLEERVKVVEAAEAQLSDFEMKADGFRRKIKAQSEELGFVTKSLEECKIEETSKAAQLNGMLELLRKIQVDIDLKTEQLGQVETDLERRRCELSVEVEHLNTSQTRRRELDEETERKTKDLTLVLDKISECEKLFQTRSSELIKTQDEVELKGKQLEQINVDIEKINGKVRAEIEHLDRCRTCSRDMEEELERKKNDLTAVLDKSAECGKQLELIEKKLDSQQKLLKTRSLELVSKEEKLVGLDLDFDLREDRVSVLANEMESKAKELEDIERLIKDRSAHNESIKLLFEEHTEELASKEKRQNEITEDIRKLSLEIAIQQKTLERAREFIQELSVKQCSKQRKVESIERRLEKSTAKYDSKKKELCSTKVTFRDCHEKLEIKERELKSLQSVIIERNKQAEEEEKKKQHLEDSNEELVKQLQVKQEAVCLMNKKIRECSEKLESKNKHLDQVQSSITDLTAELKSKECDLNSMKTKIHVSLKDFQSKEDKQVILKASLRKREQELGLKEKQFDVRSEKIQLKEKELDAREGELDEKDQVLKSTEQKLAECVKELELKAKKLSSFCQQSDQDQHVDLVQDANVCDEKTLQCGHLKRCHQLHLDVSNSLKSSSDPAKLVLDTIETLHQRMAVTKLDPSSFRRSSICLLECLMDMSPEPTTEVRGEAIKFATEWKNTTLVKAENPVEVLGFLHFLAAFSLAYSFDAEKVKNLFDGAFLRKYVPSLCEALGVSLVPVNNVLSLNEISEQQQPREAPVSNKSDSHCLDIQENITSSHLANDDFLTDIEGSTCFSPSEVFTGLKVMNDPGSYVLNSVSDALMDAKQRGELGLAEPMVKNLVSLLEELLCVVSPSKHLHLLSYALQVANRWSKMMGNSAKISRLSVWGFLQLIVAYGLVHRTDRDSTLRFAKYVVCFKKAPKLFESLGLSYAISDLVIQLLKERCYIPAIRFIFHFNLNRNFFPLEFLKEEINNLRRSAKEKRRFDSQADDKDAGRLRDIIELIDDFKLDIDLPVELIVKFMVPHDNQNQNQYFVSSYVPVQPQQQVHMQASHTVIQSSYIATHGSNLTFPTSLDALANQQVLDLETYQAGGSTTSQAQSSHLSGFKRPRMDPSVPRPVIRPCFNPSSYGRC